jgi:hypothetical protein
MKSPKEQAKIDRLSGFEKFFFDLSSLLDYVILPIGLYMLKKRSDKNNARSEKQ